MVRLQREYGVQVVFSPLIDTRVTGEEFEAMTGLSLNGFDALLGLCNYIESPSIESRMINTPVVEFATKDKAMQYSLLGDIAGLNIPVAVFLDGFFGASKIREMQERYGKVVYKTRAGSLGEGIGILDAGNVDGFLRIFADMHYGAMEEFGYTEEDFSYDTVREVLTQLYSLGPDEANYLARRRLDDFGVVIQQFVDARSVIYRETGGEHFAKARLIWFDGYMDGYWGLSKTPVSEASYSDRIVNWTRTRMAQKFTPNEERMFREYAESVVPPVLEILEPYVGSLQSYRELERELQIASVLRQQC